MTATVSVVTKHARDALTVPSSAFRYRPSETRRNQGFSVLSMFTGSRRPPGSAAERAQPKPTDGSRLLYVLKDGRPRPVSVKVGASDGERTEVLSGLSEGDLVITASQQRG